MKIRDPRGESYDDPHHFSDPIAVEGVLEKEPHAHDERKDADAVEKLPSSVKPPE